jgi:hypothetical protein
MMAVDRVIRWSTALAVLGVAAVAAVASYEHAAHGLGHGVIGAAVAAWPAVALVGSYELLMMVIRGSHVPVKSRNSESERVADALQELAAEVFAEELVAGRVPPVRASRAQLHVGQP